MNFHLDILLNLPNATVESCAHIDQITYFKIGWLHEEIECSLCGAKTAELHQTKETLIRDLPVFGRPVYLKVPHRRFYCRHCQHYISEQLEFIDWRRHQTSRYQAYVYQRVKVTTVLQVSREENLSENQVQSIFKLGSEPIKKKTGDSPSV